MTYTVKEIFYTLQGEGANAGTVSALMMGAAWGAAGIVFIPLTGWVSDHYSMQHAFAGLVVIPLLGFLLALKLPK